MGTFQVFCFMLSIKIQYLLSPIKKQLRSYFNIKNLYAISITAIGVELVFTIDFIIIKSKIINPNRYRYTIYIVY